MNKRWSTIVVAAAVVAFQANGVHAQSVNGLPGGSSTDQQLRDEGMAREAARKREVAEAILSAREAAAGRPLAALRPILKLNLLDLSLERLEAIAAMAPAEANAAIGQALGDTAATLSFTPVAPCRVVDTRSATTGILVAGVDQSFLVRNAGGFVSQGGSATDCGIPATATAVEMNFVAVGPAGAGDLRVFAFGGTLPTASVINYATLPSLNIANGIAQPVCNPATATCTKDLTIHTDVANTHLVLDVVGYFAATPSPRTTQLIYSGQTNATPTGTPAAFKTLGTFTKAVAGTAILVTWQGHARMAGTPGTTFCQFQLRVDGATPTGTTDENGLGAVLYAADAPAALTGRWTGLAAGDHTLSVYLRGAATTCTLNAGNFSNQVAYVQEF